MEVGSKSRKHGPRTSKPRSTANKVKDQVSKAIAVANKGVVTFLLCDGSERTQMVKSQCISVDSKGQRTRMRYIEGIKELEYAKQVGIEGKNAAYIVMRKGKLTTGDQTLIKYLKMHPSYDVLFYVYDPVQVAKDELARDEAVDNAVWYARVGLNDEEAYELAKLLKLPNIDSLQMPQIRIFLKKCAMADPKEFNEKRVGSEAKINNLLSKAFESGSVEFKGNSLMYTGGGIILDKIPNVENDAKMEFVVRWIITDLKGQEFLENITD